MKLSFFGVMRAQLKPKAPVVTTDLSGKTVIVIGANVGVGFEAAKHFAEMNPARLILACRNEAKGNAAITKIEEATGYKKSELWLLDLSRFSSVLEFVDKFEKDGGRLDILLANAGITGSKYETTSDGWESTLQVNDLATFLLCILLLPRLVHTAREFSTTPRLVVVASDIHYFASVDKAALDSPKVFETLNTPESYSSMNAVMNRYAVSKLFDVFFVRALNAHLPPSTPVLVTAVNPGLCATELGQKEPEGFIASCVRYVIFRTFAHTAEEGSRELVWACVGGQEREDDLRGAFVWHQQITEVSDYVLSPEGAALQERLWNELLEILGGVSPKVPAIVGEYLA
ncbi:Short chain dehydrogenase sol3 [Sparassis crispa]|uniref:Short chain dehydrogenase sol3 n=1 Tax=Sparassis crispa TaxID=139825 RepID=A0A401GII0_9APHY|nr:Short chain dehydrogenase sol3 [Sparassis crispa]GBE81921.1 Short chain dehydrogenase sol3 [Sparassis crispa]